MRQPLNHSPSHFPGDSSFLLGCKPYTDWLVGNMPCGGIYYFGSHVKDSHEPPGSVWCLQCGRRDTLGIDHLDHFCIEWDGYLHSACVVQFLEQGDGQTVVNHMHTLELGPNVVFTLETVDVESVDQPQISAVSETAEER